MKGDWIFLWLILSLVLSACNRATPDIGTGPQLKIMYEAGHIPDTSWNYLPYPTHFGDMDGKGVFLLSKAPKIGSTRSIRLIAELTTIENGAQAHWIIANDGHPDYKIQDLNTANDLMTRHNGIKSTLERWIMSRKGIGAIQLQGWKETPPFVQSDNQ